MRIKSTMAPLVLCLAVSLTTSASARPRHHQGYPPMTEYSAYQQPMMMQGGPEGPVMQSLTPQKPIRQARNARAQARLEQAQPAQATFSPQATGPMSFGGGSSLVAEARHWIGSNPTGRSSLWCGNFMNFVLERTGHRGSSSNQARSFASYGQRLSGPQVGAIAVMSRGRNGGHVGVVSGIDPDGNPIIISGNHGRRVGEGVYSRGRVYAYVMP